MPFIHLKAEKEMGKKGKFLLSQEIYFCFSKGLTVLRIYERDDTAVQEI